MSRGLGRIERAIAAEIAEAAVPNITGEIGTVMIRSDGLINDLYRPMDENGWPDWKWKPAPAQRKAATRAMRSFARKHQQYALAGGQGRRELYLYDAADPVSVMWTKLNVERRQRNPISRSAAKAALAQLGTASADAP